jgi:hypothetical protein
MDDFPEFDTFEDYRGKEIRFRYDLNDAGNIYALRATEVMTGSAYGRHFAVYDGASPWNALYKMRRRIPRALNIRYFAEEDGDPFGNLNFDRFRGSITHDDETKGACLVVDGKKMSMSQLDKVLTCYEGWQIEVRITEE